jgi:hypothetical protein
VLVSLKRADFARGLGAFPDWFGRLIGSAHTAFICGVRGPDFNTVIPKAAIDRGAASTFVASIALTLPQWGKYRRATVSYRAIDCGGMHRVHGREELRAAFVAAGRLANSRADLPHGIPVVTSAVTLQVGPIRAS